MTMSDQELLGRMLDGDEDAFTALYRRRQAAVFRFALQMSGSVMLAEDATQEAFLSLIAHGRRFDPVWRPEIITEDNHGSERPKAARLKISFSPNTPVRATQWFSRGARTSVSGPSAGATC